MSVKRQTTCQGMSQTNVSHFLLRISYTSAIQSHINFSCRYLSSRLIHIKQSVSDSFAHKSDASIYIIIVFICFNLHFNYLNFNDYQLILEFVKRIACNIYKCGQNDMLFTASFDIEHVYLCLD